MREYGFLLTRILLNKDKIYDTGESGTVKPVISRILCSENNINERNRKVMKIYISCCLLMFKSDGRIKKVTH